ncbi:cache domain-containing protein [Aquabacterium sp. A7-Y]|uniref:cache domain-containing protein n=1 Tax=Aquabacterium sp. A7-Y TaxID=1349605 RepID=UPI00223CC0BE|nr:cache domain-containing protein [Aquabacterium sp. A7-Y]MCW7537378.1 cache domain-containing protein [Aquabacterium sp. A7-Y]
MFSKFSRTVSIALVAGFVSFGAAAQERGTKEEAKAMAEAAAAHVKKVGTEKAFKDFATDKATWIKKDMYVFSLDFSGNMLLHPITPQLVGKNLSAMKSDNGTSSTAQMTEIAKTKGAGWYEYDFTHPATKKVEKKASYVIRNPGADSYIGVGVYR